MYEYHNNTLCVRGNWLIENILFSENTYKSLVTRKKLTVVRRGGGLATPSLIEFDSIRTDLKEKIVELTGDPTEKAKNIIFRDYIKPDTAASDFFNDYTLENKEGLPEKNIKEYIANAEIFNAIEIVLSSTMSKRKALGAKVKPWEKIATVVSELPLKQWPHSLPTNARRLQDKFKAYKDGGYQSLIHKGFCHKNSEKLNDDAKPWILARWCDQVKRCASHAQLLKEYNAEAEQQDWKPLKTEQTLINFLYDSKIEPLWYGFRFGQLKSKEKYGLQLSTKLPSLRDSLWYSDGTKLNYVYQEDGKILTCQVYEVFDAYSEVFIGYHISKTEDFEAQYQAYKMALQISGHKPYEIKFDNQGGHKKLESNSFLGKISRICANTMPYNGKSKTIENAFYRFQAGYLKQDWFFTGQNIQSKKAESKANWEFILRNKADLPTLDEVKAIYAKRRREWNEAAHPKTEISRLETYLNSHNPETPAINIWDMVDMFWIQRDKAVTCTAYGISFTEKKQTYTYLVYDENREPDIMWLRENIDRKFTIKYDPDDMTLIHLYVETPLGLKRVAAAETKIEVHRNRQEQEEWEASFITKVLNKNQEIMIKERDRMNDIMADYGRTAEDYGLRSTLIPGMESTKKRQPKKEKTSIGHYQKEVSNVVLNTDNDTDIYSMM